MLTDPQGIILDWSAGAERMFGWTREEVLGRTPAILHHAEEAATLTDKINATAITAGAWTGEIAFIRKDGTPGLCETTTVPLRDKAGSIYATVGINRDITERKKANALLLAERHLLRSAIDLIPEPVFIKDREGRQIVQNLANVRKFGFTDSDDSRGLGMTVWELEIPREYAEQYAADDARVLVTGQPLLNREEPYRRIDGSTGWLLTSKHPLRDARGEITGLIGIARDISALKEAGVELDGARQRLGELMETAPLAVIEWTPEMVVRQWRGRAQQIFGWEPEEVVGHRLGDWPFVHPEDSARVAALANALMSDTHGRTVGQNRNLTKTGGTVHCEWHNSVLRGPGGKIIAILSLVEDVTERVRAEAENAAMEQKMQETQKLEGLGVMAGGIAHDFNNLLAVIVGNASLAAESLSDPAFVAESLHQIDLAATRAADLCKQLLAYSGRGRVLLQRLDLNGLITETSGLLGISISKKAELRMTLGTGLSKVMGDATQLRQVLMNLIINASEAIGETGGTIDVRTSIETFSEDDLQSFRLCAGKPGAYVRLQVHDNGPGMSADVLARIFEPFFTTKFTGRGLGLAATLGIVRGHHGCVEVFSEPGQGTRFTVLLPCDASDIAAETAPPRPREPHAAGHGTVLVIDDEDGVRKTLGRMLAVLGFTVLLAEDGVRGLEIFAEEPPGTIRLVLLDYTMPRMGGEETYRALRLRDAQVPVLLISGYSEQEIASRFAEDELVGCLSKPFQLPVLRERLQAVLA